MEIMDVMVDKWKTALITINLTKLNPCPLILTLEFNKVAIINKVQAWLTLLASSMLPNMTQMQSFQL